MALPNSGQISFSQLQTEFGGSNPISLSEYYAGGSYVLNPPPTSAYQSAAIPTSGMHSISRFFGVSAAVPIPTTWAYQDSLSKSQSSWGISVFNNQQVLVTTMAYGSSKVVALGGHLQSATSTDGVTWTVSSNLQSQYTVDSNTDPLMLASVWNGSMFVAVGASKTSGGAPICATSSDGSTWARRTNIESTLVIGGTPYTPRAIAWGNSRFVAGTDAGYVVTSTDGSTWTLRTALNISDGSGMTCLIWDGSKFVAGMTSGMVYTSTDGITWTSKYDMNNNTSWVNQGNGIQKIGYNGSLYVMCGSSGGIATSTDLVNWTYRSSLSSTTWSTNQIQDIVWTGSKWVIAGAAGTYSTGTSGIATSTDGITWSYQSGIMPPSWLEAIVWTGSKLVVGGDYGYIGTSTDGATWTYQDDLSKSLTSWGFDDNNIVNSMATNGTTIVAVGAGTKTDGGINGVRVATSTDGITWTNQLGLASTAWTAYGPALRVVWTGSVFAVVGDSGKFATSPDGITWTYRSGLYAAGGAHVTNPVGPGDLYTYGSPVSMIWTGTKFVVGGYSGKIFTSPDGITWTNQTGLSSTTFGTATVYALGWSGSTMIASGVNGKMATSSDGVTWTYRSQLSTTTWGATGSSVATVAVWDGSKFVIIGVNGASATSTDGATWTYRSSLASTSFASGIFAYGLVWSGSVMFAVGANGVAATSTDGITWTYQAGLSGLSNWGTVTAKSAVWHNGKLVVGGSKSKVATFT